MVVDNARRRDSIIEYVLSYRAEHGFSPSIREIADHENTSPSNVFRIMQQMVNQGEVASVAGRARTWIPVDPVPF